MVFTRIRKLNAVYVFIVVVLFWELAFALPQSRTSRSRKAGPPTARKAPKKKSAVSSAKLKARTSSKSPKKAVSRPTRKNIRASVSRKASTGKRRVRSRRKVKVAKRKPAYYRTRVHD